MGYDHCRFCGKTVRFDGYQVSCPTCFENIELELLKSSYWMIHESGGEFIRPEQLISRIHPIRDKKLDLYLLRSWVLRGLLTADVWGRVAVPEEDLVPEEEVAKPQAVHLLRCIRGRSSKLPALLSGPKSPFRPEREEAVA